MHLTPVKLEAGTFTGPEFDQAFAAAMRKAAECPPPVVNESVATVTAPTASGLVAGTPPIVWIDVATGLPAAGSVERVESCRKYRRVSVKGYVSILVRFFRLAGVLEVSIFQKLDDPRVLRLRVRCDSESQFSFFVKDANGSDTVFVVPFKQLGAAFLDLPFMRDFRSLSVSCKFHRDAPFVAVSKIMRCLQRASVGCAGGLVQ